MANALSFAADILPETAPTGAAHNAILIHGLAASRCDWVWLAPELHKAGYRTIAPDLLGHGDSYKPTDPGLYTVSAMYALFEHWIESLALETPFVMLGHSLGGNLCLRYAHRHPDHLAGLVLIDPLFSPAQLSRPMQALFRRPHLVEYGMRYAPPWLVNALIGLDPLTVNNFPSSVKEQISHDYLRASPQIMQLPPTSGDLLHILPEVRVQTLVIWGERDLTLKPSSFEQLVKAMPCAGWRSVPKCGHQPHLARPDVVNPWVLEFLQSLGNGRSA